MDVGIFVIIIAAMAMLSYIAKRILNIMEINAKKPKKVEDWCIKKEDAEDFLDERII